jgi:phosphoribosylformylglycinamidine cyclo-ligase
MASSGLHSNGYSLVRHVLLGAPEDGGQGWSLDRHVPELGRILGEELLVPTRIYAKGCLDLARHTRTHAMAHVTGGGLAANLARVLPEEVEVVLERGTWTPQPVFSLLRDVGVPQPDLEGTLNLGVGMVAVVDRDDADTAVARLATHGVQAWVCGEVRLVDGSAEPGAVRLVGAHPGW